jgi:predicted nucleotidyltransferase
MLVELDPEGRVGLFKMVGMELELSDLIGRKVDLRTPNELSKYFRQRVLDDAEVQYVRRR